VHANAARPQARRRGVAGRRASSAALTGPMTFVVGHYAVWRRSSSWRTSCRPSVISGAASRGHADEGNGRRRPIAFGESPRPSQSSRPPRRSSSGAKAIEWTRMSSLPPAPADLVEHCLEAGRAGRTSSGHHDLRFELGAPAARHGGACLVVQPGDGEIGADRAETPWRSHRRSTGRWAMPTTSALRPVRNRTEGSRSCRPQGDGGGGNWRARAAATSTATRAGKPAGVSSEISPAGQDDGAPGHPARLPAASAPARKGQALGQPCLPRFEGRGNDQHVGPAGDRRETMVA